MIAVTSLPAVSEQPETVRQHTLRIIPTKMGRMCERGFTADCGEVLVMMYFLNRCGVKIRCRCDELALDGQMHGSESSKST